ncbi:autotransporter outer membrane beta-barrel domain-containing protein [Pseudomonas sp. F1_0610]|uniref:autotransporter outer membrane beta-barrel domain-containing protein n=1 Tax=Pseudomonas sp. F1_0610 TaxID=3114284 RepID=UPI0039C40B8F
MAIATGIDLTDGLHKSNQSSFSEPGSVGGYFNVDAYGDEISPAFGIKSTGSASVIMNADKYQDFKTIIKTEGYLSDGIIAGRLGALNGSGVIVDTDTEEGARFANSQVIVYGETHISSVIDQPDGVAYGLRVIGDGANIQLLKVNDQVRSTVFVSGAAIRFDYGNGYSVNADGSSAKNAPQTITLENVDLSHQGLSGSRVLANNDPSCLIFPDGCDTEGLNTQTHGHLIEVGNHDVEAGGVDNNGQTTMTVANAVKNGVLNLNNSSAIAMNGKDLLHVTYGGGTTNVPDTVSSSFTLNATNNTVLNGSVFTDTTLDHQGAKSTSTLNLDSSTWYLPRDSNVTQLTLRSAASVHIGGDQTVPVTATNKVTLTLDRLEGSGSFHMRTDIINSGLSAISISDQLHVQGEAKGNHSVFVTDHNTGGLTATGNEKVTLAHIASGDAVFGLGNLNGYIDLGAHRYKLQTEVNSTGGQDWFLAASNGVEPPKPDTLTNTANNAANILDTNYLLNTVEIDLLFARMKQARSNERLQGLWIKHYNGSFGSIKTKLQRFDLDYKGVLAGYDRHMTTGAGELSLGVMAGYSDSDVNYKQQSGKGSVHNYHFGLYGALINEDQQYVDGFIKYSRLTNRFDARTGFGYKVTGKSRINSYSAGFKIGQQFYLSEDFTGWYLDPHAKLTYTYFEHDKVKASNGLVARLDAMNSVLGSLNLTAGYQLDKGPTVFDFYVGTGIGHEFDGKSYYQFNSDLYKTHMTSDGSGWNTLLGVSIEYRQQHNFLLNVNHTSAKKFNSTGIELGYRFIF